MKIRSSEFIKSAFDRRQWITDGLPEIAFLGRSNVGKSSLLNSLLNRKGLATHLKYPGRTQSINYFLINGNSILSTFRGTDMQKCPNRRGPIGEKWLGII
jgi:GTP-binding protein